MKNSPPLGIIPRSIVYGALLLITCGLSITALVLPISNYSARIPLQLGDVAVQDILAPYEITYESQVLTDRQRDAAADAVEPVYLTIDASIARRQVERLRTALAYIVSVRADEFASLEQKIVDLSALEDIQFNPQSSEQILSLNDERWQVIRQEAIVVLEQVMRSTIREDRLEDARRSVPALVSLSIPEDQANIVAELVSAFVAPNSLYSAELTDQARSDRRVAVQPITRSFVATETVVERGQVISAEDLEALDELGLVHSPVRWQDITSASAIVLVCATFIILYLQHKPDQATNLRGLVLISILFLLFLYSARVIIPGRAVIPYAFPLVGFGLLLTALFSVEVALVFSIPLGIFVAYGMQNVHELTLYYVLSGMVGILILRKAQRLTAFFWAGASIGSAGAAIVLAYRLISSTTDLFGMLTLVGAAYIFGLASAGLAVLLQFILAPLLDLTTPLQLIDVSRPDHPLLQYILRNSPGTYQHSLQVANLAEQAAKRIDANALLTRVGSLYHDAGKAQNPYYFIENQIPGYPNPHDNLPAEDSARIIIQHVHDGLELASKHRLPRRISEFISEHHGTLITRYQYAKAIEEAGGDEGAIDLELYRYPGPRPQSRETALLMLADGCEARLRAERPSSESEIRKIIKNLIDNRMDQGQLDDIDLTLRDLNEVLESFVATLRGVHHPRIEYPAMEANEVEKVASTTGDTLPPTGEELTTIPSSQAESNPQSEL